MAPQHGFVQHQVASARLELAEVLDAPAAQAEQRIGEDQPEDRDPLDRLPRVHEVAVAELRARPRVEEVDRHGGRVDLGELRKDAVCELGMVEGFDVVFEMSGNPGALRDALAKGRDLFADLARSRLSAVARVR